MHITKGKVVAEVEFKTSIAEDRGTVAVEIASGDRPSFGLSITLDQLTALIGHLGEVRRQMVAGQPNPDLRGQTISVAGDTTWWIEASPPNGCLFAFYHPGFGSVGFTLTASEVSKLADFLKERFPIAPPAAESRPSDSIRGTKPVHN